MKVSTKQKDSLKAFKLLLDGGYYMHPRTSFSGSIKYCVYDTERRPVLVISAAAYRELSDMLRKHKGFLVINKSFVRGMHKNSLFYKYYKKQNEIRKSTSGI